MIAFIEKYGLYILAIFSILLELIVILIKRKPKTFDDFVSILSECALSLPSMISSVEVPGKGYEKKIAVIDSFKKLVSKKLGRALSNKEMKIFSDFVSSQIELILTTPQKKEI